MTPEVRWSTTVTCPRQSCYAVTLPAPDREPTDLEQRTMWRGWTAGRDYADAVAISLGCQHCQQVVRHGQRTSNHHGCPIIREKPVTWPAGTMHTDIFLVDAGMPVEVLSSANPAGEQIDRKLLQLAGQIHYDPDVDGDEGRLVIVNPRDYTEEKIRFRLDDDWRNRVEDAAEQVTRGLADGRLPERVCRHPGDGPSRFCRYAETCFADWEPPALEELDLAGYDRMRFVQLRLLKDQRAQLKQSDRDLEANQRQVEAELAEHVPVGEWVVDGLRVVRAHRTRESFGRKQAHDAGIPEHVIRAHTTVSEWDEWKVDEVLPGALARANEGGTE